MSENHTRFQHFIDELRRRRVFRVAGSHAILTEHWNWHIKTHLT